MTISSTNRIAGPFTGDGTTATFPFTFKVFEDSDLYVVTLNLSTGALTVLTLTTDYSVTLDADQDTNPGGSITLTAGNLATGLTLTITTDIAALQGVDLTNGGGFYPDVINGALDLLTILIQQLLDTAARSLQYPMGDTTTNAVLPSAAQRAGMVLAFDSNGNPELLPFASGSIVPGSQTAAGTINGVNKNFTFTAASTSTPSILVFAAGAFQDPATDYGVPTLVTGATWQITFTNAPLNGPIKILMLG